MVRTINPATGEVLRDFEVRGGDWLEKSVAASTLAYALWSRQELEGRLRAVEKFEAVLKGEREALARLMTLEMGKPIKQSLSEVDKCLLSSKILRENYPIWLREREYAVATGHSVHCVPLGPILGIMPWNFPLWQVVRFAIPTLLGGNTILLKHAPNTWGSAEKIEEIFSAAFPSGVFVNLPIEVALVEKLIADPRVRGVSLTGSTRAGRSVGELCGLHLKKCVLELGGSDAYVVLEDADVELAAQVCAEARLVNGGQSCVAAKRFIVHQKIVGEFTEKMVARMGQKTMGDPMKMETDIGPLARLDLRDGLADQVNRSLARGARKRLGAETPSGPGFFYPPSVLAAVLPGQPAFDDELFGPVAAVIEASSDREAIQLANQSKYGLGGAIFSRDFERAKALAMGEMEAGMVFINDFVKSDALVPFGGIKDSGLGRELGREGSFEFINPKLIYVRSTVSSES